MNAQTKLKISYSLRGRKKSATHAHTKPGRCKKQKKDKSTDLSCSVAGEGFEPTTSGL